MDLEINNLGNAKAKQQEEVGRAVLPFKDCRECIKKEGKSKKIRGAITLTLVGAIALSSYNLAQKEPIKKRLDEYFLNKAHAYINKHQPPKLEIIEEKEFVKLTERIHFSEDQLTQIVEIATASIPADNYFEYHYENEKWPNMAGLRKILVSESLTGIINSRVRIGYDLTKMIQHPEFTRFNYDEEKDIKEIIIKVPPLEVLSVELLSVKKLTHKEGLFQDIKPEEAWGILTSNLNNIKKGLLNEQQLKMIGSSEAKKSIESLVSLITLDGKYQGANIKVVELTPSEYLKIKQDILRYAELAK